LVSQFIAGDDNDPVSSREVRDQAQCSVLGSACARRSRKAASRSGLCESRSTIGKGRAFDRTGGPNNSGDSNEIIAAKTATVSV
jgi:hypothetical protein